MYDIATNVSRVANETYSHTRLLWDHWDRRRIHWFPGNHLIHLDKGKYLKEMARFLKEIEFDKP